MSLENLAKIIAQAAPLLGGVLAGPAGAAIGSIVAAKFGGSMNNTTGLIQRIEADPEAQLKLLEIQSNNEVELQRIYMLMAENQLKYAYLEKENEYKDRDSARQKEAALAQAGKRDATPAVLAYLLTIGVFAALYYLFMHTVPVSNKELIVGIVSALSTVWVGAMAYYHGSSAGSNSKNALLLHTQAMTHQTHS